MASWTLGKIFSVEGDEGGEVAKDDVDHVRRSGAYSDSGDDDEDDDEAAERQAAFNKNKENSSNTNASNRNALTGSNRSIRRYDEYGNFLSRSERARAEKKDHPSQPTSVLKTSNHNHKDSGLSGKRRIQFKSGTDLLDILEIPYMTSEEKALCFMGRANWYVRMVV